MEVMENGELTIRQVAEDTGLTKHTLRYYERIGLLPHVKRAPNGHRRYLPGHIEWIILINHLRSTGMSIQQMQHYVDLIRRGESTFAEREEFLEAHRCKVEAHIHELNQNLAYIEKKIQSYRRGKARQAAN